VGNCGMCVAGGRCVRGKGACGNGQVDKARQRCVVAARQVRYGAASVSGGRQWQRLGVWRVWRGARCRPRPRALSRVRGVYAAASNAVAAKRWFRRVPAPVPPATSMARQRCCQERGRAREMRTIRCAARTFVASAAGGARAGGAARRIAARHAMPAY